MLSITMKLPSRADMDSMSISFKLYMNHSLNTLLQFLTSIYSSSKEVLERMCCTTKGTAIPKKKYEVNN